MARPQTPPQKTFTTPPTRREEMPMDAAMRERIARRAYELYTARGGDQGRDLDDWLQAERELRLGRQ